WNNLAGQNDQEQGTYQIVNSTGAFQPQWGGAPIWGAVCAGIELNCSAPPPMAAVAAIPRAIPTPSRGESGEDTTEGAAGSITVGGGGSAPELNELAIVSIGVLDPPAGFSITPPSTLNLWNLIDMEPVNGDYFQQIWWHAIGSDETGSAPSFEFTFSSPVEATGVAILYLNTCTQTTPTPCFSNSGIPYLSPVGSGTATGSNSVTETSALTLQANGLALCAFGTSNTSVGIGGAGGGTITPSGLSFNNGNSGTNAGLLIYNQFGLGAGMAGPWKATLGASETGDNVAQCLSILPIGF
ncbi:MAG TPA: hypothetical protein VJX23_16050, partial [Candidatus Binataceae bacterium]|nr:hypothetical protein [Candidatus Binataceae bacterium]